MSKISTFAVVKSLVIAEAVACFAFSYTHIQKVLLEMGFTGWFPNVFPLMIDGLAVLGFIGRSSNKVDDEGQKAGTYLMIGVGLVSLVCNVAAGENGGQRLIGAVTVGLFVAAEWYAAKLNKRPEPQPQPEPVVVEEAPAHPLKGRKLTPEQIAARNAARIANQYAKATPAEKRAMARQGLKPATA